MSSSDSHHTWLNALSYLERGEIVAAEMLLRSIAEGDIYGDSIYHAALICLLGMVGRTDEALESAEQALEKFPEEASIHIAQAIAYQHGEDKNASKRSTQKALELEPNNPTALHHMSTLLYEEGQLEKAKHHSLAAFQAIPHNLNYALTACEILEATGERDISYEIAQVAADYHPDDEAIVERVMQGAIARQELERAWQLIQEQEESKQENPLIIGWKATLLELEGHPEEARAVFDHYYEKFIENPQFLFLYACFWHRCKEAEPAMELISKILSIEPRHAGAHKVREEIRLWQNSTQEGLELLEEQFEEDLSAETAWELVTQYYRQGHHQKALDFIAELEEDELVPSPLLPVIFKMLCYAALNDATQALDLFQEMPPHLAPSILVELGYGACGAPAEELLKNYVKQRFQDYEEQLEVVDHLDEIAQDEFAIEVQDSPDLYAQEEDEEEEIVWVEVDIDEVEDDEMVRPLPAFQEQPNPESPSELYEKS